MGEITLLKMDDDYYPYYPSYETTRRPYYYRTTGQYDYDWDEYPGEITMEHEEELRPISESFHIKPWMMVAGVGIIILVLTVILSLFAWWIGKKKKLSSGTAKDNALNDANDIEKQEGIEETEQ